MAFLLILVFGASQSAFAHGDLIEQIDRISALIVTTPSNAELYYRRAELYRAHEQWQEAASDYDRAQQLAPELVAVHLGRGRLWLDSGQLEKAKTEFDKFLVAYPDHVEGMINRGRTQVLLGQPRVAVEDFSRAIALVNSPEPELYLDTARALASVNPASVDAALQVLDDGIAKLGELPTLALYAIELEVGASHYDSALSRLDKLAAGAVRKETWLEQRGDILTKAGRADSASAAYRDALTLISALPLRLQSVSATLALEHRLQAKLATHNPIGLSH